MRINYFRLTIFILMLISAQLMVNNTKVVYLDCLTLLLVMLLLDGIFSIRLLFIICLCADLFGHWYLGTHLIAITLVSFLTKGFVNFYRMSNVLQKIVLSGIFSLIAYTLITLIALLAHNSNFNWPDIVIEVTILNPIILLFLHYFIIKLSPDIIRTE